MEADNIAPTTSSSSTTATTTTTTTATSLDPDASPVALESPLAVDPPLSSSNPDLFVAPAQNDGTTTTAAAATDTEGDNIVTTTSSSLSTTTSATSPDLDASLVVALETPLAAGPPLSSNSDLFVVPAPNDGTATTATVGAIDDGEVVNVFDHQNNRNGQASNIELPDVTSESMVTHDASNTPIETNGHDNDDNDNNNNNTDLGIDKKCSHANILTVDGRYDCLSACNDAICCQVPGIIACPAIADTIGVESYCAQHESCKNVHTVTKEEVDVFCDVNTGDVNICETLCDPAQCCFDDTKPCLIHKKDCNLYESCEKPTLATTFNPTTNVTDVTGAIPNTGTTGTTEFPTNINTAFTPFPDPNLQGTIFPSSETAFPTTKGSVFGGGGTFWPSSEMSFLGSFPLTMATTEPVTNEVTFVPTVHNESLLPPPSDLVNATHYPSFELTEQDTEEKSTDESGQDSDSNDTDNDNLSKDWVKESIEVAFTMLRDSGEIGDSELFMLRNGFRKFLSETIANLDSENGGQRQRNRRRRRLRHRSLPTSKGNSLQQKEQVEPLILHQNNHFQHYPYEHHNHQHRSLEVVLDDASVPNITLTECPKFANTTANYCSIANVEYGILVVDEDVLLAKQRYANATASYIENGSLQQTLHRMYPDNNDITIVGPNSMKWIIENEVVDINATFIVAAKDESPISATQTQSNNNKALILTAFQQLVRNINAELGGLEAGGNTAASDRSSRRMDRRLIIQSSKEWTQYDEVRLRMIRDGGHALRQGRLTGEESNEVHYHHHQRKLSVTLQSNSIAISDLVACPSTMKLPSYQYCSMGSGSYKLNVKDRDSQKVHDMYTDALTTAITDDSFQKELNAVNPNSGLTILPPEGEPTATPTSIAPTSTVTQIPTSTPTTIPVTVSTTSPTLISTFPKTLMPIITATTLAPTTTPTNPPTAAKVREKFAVSFYFLALSIAIGVIAGVLISCFLQYVKRKKEEEMRNKGKDGLNFPYNVNDNDRSTRSNRSEGSSSNSKEVGDYNNNNGIANNSEERHHQQRGSSYRPLIQDRNTSRYSNHDHTDNVYEDQYDRDEDYERFQDEIEQNPGLDKEKREKIRKEVIEIVERDHPEWVVSLGDILSEYRGREDELLTAVQLRSEEKQKRKREQQKMKQEEMDVSDQSAQRGQEQTTTAPAGQQQSPRNTSPRRDEDSDYSDEGSYDPTNTSSYYDDDDDYSGSESNYSEDDIDNSSHHADAGSGSDEERSIFSDDQQQQKSKTKVQDGDKDSDDDNRSITSHDSLENNNDTVFRNIRIADGSDAANSDAPNIEGRLT